MSRAKVSIVVPIYNVEQYLGCCIDSLLSQTLDSIEIILVDDGSPDSSGEIAERYAQKDLRVKVLHRSNGGLGPARNTGIDNSSGEYVGFVDSDDWVEPRMYERLYKTAKKESADIVIGGHKDVLNGKVINIKPHPLSGEVFRGREEIAPVQEKLFGHAPDEASVEAFPMRVWTGIYRLDFLRKKGLAFRSILSEDTLFNIPAYGAASIIAFSGYTDYCYRMDDHPSIMRSFNSNKIFQYAEFLDALHDLTNVAAKPEECSHRADRMAVDYCRLYVGQIVKSNLSYSEKQNEVNRLIHSKFFKSYCARYPVKLLPLQQRLFHQALLKGRSREALFLLSARQRLKTGIWK